MSAALFALCAYCAVTPSAQAAGALPTGGNFAAGSGAISQAGNALTVNQASQRAIINWNSFSIGQGNGVQINNGAGATLNRVITNAPSTIAGTLKSTGSTYLINQNGIIVTPTGKVLTGGSFVGSTRDTSNDGFMAGGAQQFTGSSTGNVVNQGTIKSANGDAVLVGKSVSNSGKLAAPGGTAGLVAGDDVVLQPSGSGLQIQVKAGSGDATNTGTVAGAQAALDAAGGNVYALAGNNGGVVRATGTATVNGHVWLTAGGDADVSGQVSAQNSDGSGGQVTVSGTNATVTGTIDASATSSTGSGGTISVKASGTTTVPGTLKARAGASAGDGGSIETSGSVLNTAGITVDAGAPNGAAGTWLLDPYNLTVTSSASTIAPSGGTYTSGAGGSNVLNTDIDSVLNTGTSVVLQTSGTSGDGHGNGDITVSAPILMTGASAATLTLKAQGSIIIAAGSGGIVSTGGALSVILDANTLGGGGYVSILDVITTKGGAVTIGGGATPATGSAIGTAAQLDGVKIGGSITAGGGNVIINGTGSAQGGSGNNGIELDSGTLSTTGNGTVTLNGTATGNGAGTQTYGVWFNGGTISAVNGLVSVTGTNNSTGAGGNNEGVTFTGGTITSTGTGGISVTGTGGGIGSSGSFNYGVDQTATDANSILATGGSAITLNGTGGGAGGSGSINYGIILQSALAGGGGALTLTGTGGNTTSNSNFGVDLFAGVLSNTGIGSITIIANGAGSSTTESGFVNNSGVMAFTGNISITGTASTAAVGGTGIQTIGTISTGGAGTITLNGTGYGSGSANNSVGIVAGGGAGITAVNGLISLTGTSKSTSTGTGNSGISIQGSGFIQSTGSGGITINGTGGGTLSNDLGVNLATAGTLQSTNGGAISVTGIGGGGTGNNNFGVSIAGALGTNLNAPLSITGTGGNSSGTGDNGINQTAAITMAGANAITLKGTSGGSGSAAIGYAGSAGISGGGGALSITGLSGVNVASSNDYGINLSAGTYSNTGSGTITLNGTGGGSGTGTQGYGVYVNGGTVTAVNGLVSITGQSNSAGNGPGNIGVALTSGLIASTGSGGITVSGTGGGTGAGTGNYGVYLAGANVIQDIAGSAVSITGTGGNSGGTGGFGYGVSIVAAQGGSGTLAAPLSITGTGGAGGNANYGINQTAAVSDNGSITYNGTGAGGGTSEAGVSIAGSITAATGNNISITGQGSTSGSNTPINNDGIDLVSGTISTSDSGAITLNGTARYDLSSGIVVSGGAISAVDGLITLTGLNNYTNGTGNADGVLISGGTILSSGAGGMLITGTGGDGFSAAGNIGVSIANTANNALQSTGGGAITINGIGGDSGIGASGGTNVGVSIAGTIVGQGEAISITGTGGTSSGNSNYGISQFAVISNTGSGSITLNGTSGNGATGSTEVGYITSASVTAGLSGGNGNISITGSSNTFATGSADHGIEITGSGVLVSTSGSGTVTLAGTARGNASGSDGVFITTSAGVSAVDGLIKITGTNSATGTSGGGDNGISLSSNGFVKSTGLGGVTLIGTGGGSGGAGTNFGVSWSGTTAIQSIAGGAISITGTGGDNNGSGINNYGVNDGGLLGAGSTLAAPLSITGTGGNSSGTGNNGINIASGFSINPAGATAVTLKGTSGGTGASAIGVNASASVNMQGGALSITGLSGANVTGTGDDGVILGGSGAFSNTGSGAITINGTAAGTGSGTSVGVLIQSTATVTAVNGLISITGSNTSTATGNLNEGVAILITASVKSTGTGGITVMGTGGGSGASGNDYGVTITSTNSTGALQSANGGAISITGTGGDTSGSGASNYGVNIAATLGASSSLSAPLSITGTGGNSSGGGNAGVFVAGVITDGGNISFNGTGGGSGAADSGFVDGFNLTSTGGNVSITGNVSPSGTGVMGIQTTAGTISAASGYISLNTTGQANLAGSVAAAGLELLGTGGNYSFTGTSDAVTTIAANTGTVGYSQAGSLSVGTVDATTGLAASGNFTLLITGTGNLTFAASASAGNHVFASTANGNIIINSGAVISANGANDPLILEAGAPNPAGTATGGNFINNGGAGALSTPNSNWLVFTGNKVGNGTVDGGLTPYTAVGDQDTTYSPAAGANFIISREPVVILVTASLTGSVTKIYDGTLNAILSAANYLLSGVAPADQANVVLTVNGTPITSATSGLFSVKDVGNSLLITVSNLGISQPANDDYVLTATTISANIGIINPATLTLTATTDSKIYDGTTVSSATPTTSTLYGSDTVTGLSQSFASKNVLGAGNSVLNVNPTYTVNDGDGGADYTVSLVSASGTVTKAATLNIFATGQTKTYDGTTVSSATPTYSGAQTGDTVSGFTQVYGSKNVLGTNGSTLSVTAYTINDGNGGNNYATPTLHTASGTITPASLTLTAANDSKVYDGTTSSSAVPTTSTLYSTDTVTGLSQSFASKNVLGAGNSILNVNPTYTVNDGNGGADYTVSLVSASGTITKAATLNIFATSQTKTYDGTTASSATPTFSGTVGGDTISGFTQVYGSKNVLGTNGSTLSVTAYTINDGNGGNNYVTPTLHMASGTITPASLTLAATTDSKVYDGTVSSSATPTTSTLYSTDTVTDLSQSFASKNVQGTNVSTLNVNAGYAVNDGNGGADYTVALVSASGTITKAAAPTIVAVTASKIYDGTTSTTATPTYSGTVGGDTISGLTEAFISKDALGTNGSTLVVNGGYTINDGNGGNNYAAPTPGTAQGTITPAALTLTATTDSKVYDGTTSSSAMPTTSTLYSTDTVTGLSQAFASKNVLGSNNSVLNVNAGYTVNDGNGGADYTVSLVSASGTITKAAAPTITAISASKIYDGITSTTATPTYSGTVGGDTLSGLTEAFASKDVLGTNGSTLVVNAGYTVNDGNGGNNYVTPTLHTASGTITPASLTLTATTDSKVYDGTASSSATPTTSTLYSTDTVTGLSQAFASKNVLGSNNSVLNVNAGYTVNDGNGGADYTVNLVSASGTITKAATLNIFATSQTKTYDGTTASGATPTYSGAQTGDTVSGFTQVYGSKNVLGINGSTLSVTAYTINDGNGGNNYAAPVLHNSPGTITPAALDIFAVSDSKTYDGTATSSQAPTYSGLITIGGDTLTGLAQAFDSKNAGARILSVNPGYSVNDGNGGNDYSVTLHSASGSIGQATLILNARTGTKVYDGTTSSTATPTVSGLKTGDSLNATESYTSEDVLGTDGSTLVVNFAVTDGNGGGNYNVVANPVAATITPAALDIFAATDSKVYDGTVSSSGTPNTGALYNGDTVTDLSQSFASKNVLGAGNSVLNVNAGYTINDGNGGADYAVTLHTASGTITPAQLHIAATSGTKVYDGTLSSTATPSVTGLQAGDSLSASESYTSKDVLGINGSTLVVNYSVTDGNLGGNYNVVTSPVSATITPAALDIFAASDGKIYDGTTISIAVPTYSGLITVGGDTLTGRVQAFDSKNAGSRILSVTGYSVNDGNGGADYTVTLHSALGIITKATLTLTANTGTKVYDGTTSSSATPTVSGLKSGDSLSASESYISKDVLGTNGSTLVVNYAVTDGNLGGNYNVVTTPVSATITPAALDIFATSDSKTYDGTAASTATPIYTGLITVGGDTLTGLGQSFASKNVLGTNGSTLNVNPGYAINDGVGGNDYAVTLHSALGTITKANPIAIIATSDTKTYDGIDSSSQTPTYSGTFGGDTVTNLTQFFFSKDVLGANNSTLYVTSYIINDGNGGNNYQAPVLVHATGTITPAALDIFAASDGKIYDGTTISIAVPTYSGLITVGGDTLTGRVQAFDSKNAGSRILSVTGYSVNDGNGGADYVVTLHTALGNISQAILNLAASSGSKTYDGTTSSTATPTISGLKAGDSLTATESYTSEDVLGANGSTLVVNYSVTDGNGGGNYNVVTAPIAATITPAPLTLTAISDNKVYDGTTASSATPTTSTLYSTDMVTGLTQSFASKNVLGANNSVLNVNPGYTINDGNGGADYTVTLVSASGTITPAALTLTAASDTKTYDATTNSSKTPTTSTLYGSDTVTGLTQSFAFKDVNGLNGTPLIVNAGYAVNDGNGGANYTVTLVSAPGTIFKAAPIAIFATSDTKTYDGTTSSSATPTYTGTFGTDTVINLSQAFASKDVLGTNNSTLAVTGYAINDGNGGNNYQAPILIHASGSITPAALGIFATSQSKTYDGLAASNATPTYSGLITVGGDTLTGLNQAFDSKNAGARILSVNPGYSINDGNGGNDYAVTLHTASGSISQAILTLTASSGSKTYDGTTSSTATPTITGPGGLQTGDGLTATESYTSKDVLGADGSTLTVNYAISDGNGGNNYLVLINPAAGTITPAPLTLTAISDNKVYDGTVSSSQTPTTSTLYGSDTVTGLTQSFAFKDVNGLNGTPLNVNPGYVINDGNGGADYTVSLVSAPGTINKAPITLIATSDSKTYDGTTSSSATPTFQVTGKPINTLYGTDTLTSLTQAFLSKDVLGAGNSTVVVTGFAINDGNHGNDYAFPTRISATGTITPATLDISAVTDIKTYDGGTSSSLTPTTSTLYGSDTVTGLSQSFLSKNSLGTNASTLSVNPGYSVNDGNGGNDYAVTLHTALGTINPAYLQIFSVDDTKVYDGTIASSKTPVALGLMPGDTVIVATQVFGGVNVGNWGTFVSNFQVNDGNGGLNYSYHYIDDFGHGQITPAPLTITATADSKVYDGTTASSATPTVSGTLYFNGALSQQDTVTGLSQSFALKNVLGANNSVLNVNAGYSVNDGNGGNNYTVTLVAASGTITQAAAPTIAAVSASKIYDGTTATTATPTYSGTVGGDTISGLSEFFLSKDVLGANGSTLAVNGGYTINDGNGGNNYAAPTFAVTTGTITPAALDIFAVSQTKTYDGLAVSNAHPTYQAASEPANTLYGTDTLNSLFQSFDSKNAGSRTLSVNPGYTLNDGNGGNDYAVTLHTAPGSISQAILTLTASSGSKTYDGTTSSVATPSSSGTFGSDVLTATESYTSPNVAGTDGSTLTVNYAIADGNGGNNYLVFINPAAGTITPASLIITAANDNKVYDGTTISAQTPTYTGLVAADAGDLTGLTQAFNVKDVTATSTAVTGYSLSDAGNYTVSEVNGIGAISKATLTLTANTGTKTYDGTTSSTATPTVSGLQSGDSLTDSESYTFKDVLGANGSTLNVNYAVTDSGDYNVVTAPVLGTITPAALDIFAVADSKTYDGTINSSAAPTTSTLYSTDAVTGLIQSFGSKNVLGANGSTLMVNPGYAVNDGNGGNDYTVTTHTASGTITQATLTLAANTGSKVYDGTNSSTATPTSSGTFGGDILTTTESYLSPNVAGTDGSTLVVNYAVNDGNGGGNYNVVTTPVSATITPAPLTITAANDNKTYDGTTLSIQTPTYTGLVAADAGNLTGLTQAFNVKDVTATSTVVTGYSLSDAGNYTVGEVNGIGTISKATLTLGATTGTKTYDGTTSSTATPTVSGLVGGDSLTASESYTSPNVLGTNGSTLDVNYAVTDSGDYNVVTTPISATILPASLTITAANDNKTYDGTTASSATPTEVGLVAADVSANALSMGQVFQSKDVLGAGNSVLVASYSLADPNNYTVTVNTATGTISAASLTVTANTNTKTYDGTNSASATATVAGLQGSDTATSSETYATANAGTGLTLNPTVTLADPADYNVTYVSNNTGVISSASLTISATADSKVYDGTNSSSQTPTEIGLVAADVSANTLTMSQAFQSKDVLGLNGSTLVVGFNLTDLSNYNVTVHTATGTITAAPLTVTAATGSKTYDGTTSSSATPTVSGLQGSDTGTASETYFTANAGTGLTLTPAVILADPADYAVTYVANNTGAITPAALTISATTDSKVYDGTATSSVAPTETGLVAADVSANALTMSQAFASKDVLGAGNSTLVASYSLAVPSNYTVTLNTAAGTITKATLTINAVSSSKTYDGTTNSSAAPTDSGFITAGGDTISLTESYGSKDVLGAGNSTLVAAYAINDGNGGNDYSVVTNTASGTITPAPLTISAANDNKTYDGTTGSSATPTISTLYGSDTVTGLSEAFASKNVLGVNGSTLNVAHTYTVNDGNGGNDYAVSLATASGTISKAALTISAVTDSKTYDSTTSSSATPTYSGTVSGDSVTGLAQAFASKDVLGPNGSTLNVLMTYTIHDGNGGGNYSVTTNGASGTISPATLTYTANTGAGTSRTYGSNNPGFSGTVTGFAGTDTQASATTGTASFTSTADASANVGSYAITGGGLTANHGDYVFIQAAGNATALTVAPATLIYVANSASRTYGSVNPAFSGTVTGFVLSQNQGSATTGTLVFTSPATITSGVGSYPINGSGLTANFGNYIFVQAAGNATALTITPALVTLSYTANPVSRAYGAANPVLTGSLTGLLAGDTQASVTTGTLVFTTSANVNSNVGSYAINGSGLTVTSVNYNATIIQAASNATALTITAAQLTYVASPVSKVYGQDLYDDDGDADDYSPGTVIGLVNGDQLWNAAIGVPLFKAFGTSKATNVGQYAVTGFGLVVYNSNYNPVIAQAASNAIALTVLPATLTYNASSASRTYGSNNPTFGGVVTGFVLGQTQGSATTGTLSFTSPALASSNVGSYAINGSGLTANNGNYVFVQDAGNATSLTITPATLTYNANSASRTYGSSNPGFSGVVTGFVLGQSQGSATTGTLSFTSTATSSSNVGSYAINGSGLIANSGNYVFVQDAGNATSLTINPATLTYNADSASRTYGASNPSFSGVVTGFVLGQTQSSATTGTLSFTSTATSSSNVGTYAINGSGLTAKNGNYVFVQDAGNATSLTITPATLVYDASSTSRTYGASNPSFSGTVTGLVLGQTLSSQTTGTAVFTTIATSSNNVGSYAINGSGLTLKNSNYVLVQDAGNATSLTITPATLVYDANSVGRTYGANNPAFSGTVTGFVLGQNQGSATTGTLSFTSTATSSSNVGSYAINGSGLTANSGNYVFVQDAGNATSLTINPATLTYNADSTSRTYGANNPSFTGTVTGFVLGQTQATATTGTLSFTSPATSSSNIGTYAINGAGLTAKNGNYVFVQDAGNATSLTITPAQLVYDATSASRTYGSANPSITGTVTGLVLGQTLSSQTTGTAVFTTTATSSSNVGSYAINGSGLTLKNSNYVLVQDPGNATSLTITPATLVYNANSATRTYGAANPAFSGVVTGFVLGQSQATATTGTLIFTSPAASSSNVGTYAINGSGLTANSGNYVFVQDAGNATSLTITPATLTYVAGSASRTYGANNPGFSGTVTGFVLSQNQGSATTGTLSFTSPATTSSNVGSYAINGGGLTANNGNYVFVQAAGNATALTITPALLIYVANPGTKTYGQDTFDNDGDADDYGTGTVIGLVNGQSLSSVTHGTAVFLGVGTTISSNVGVYAINGSGLTVTSGNYSSTIAQAASNATALTITPATLVYNANSASRTYGASNPSFSGVVTGFVLGQTQATATTGTLSFTSTATSSSNVGSYAVNGSGLTAKNGNYVFVQDAGNATSLTIAPATLVYNANSASRTYGANNPGFSGTVTGFVLGQSQATATSGTLSFTSTATSSSNVGSYAINGAGLTANNGNYVFVQDAGNATSLTVNPATLTYNASSASRTYGSSNPTFSGVVTGFVLGQTQATATTGTLVFTSTATSSSNVGTYAINGSGLTAKSGNYVFVQDAGNATSLTINPATLIYVANDVSVNQGNKIPALTGTVTGFVLGQTQATATTGTLVFTTTANSNSNAGNYAINGSGLTAKNGNYVFVQAAGNATALSIASLTWCNQGSGWGWYWCCW